MSINPNLFASPSGIGPQTGGFNPTPADALSSPLRQNSSTGLMEYALYNDPRTRALSGLLATGLAGNQEQAARLLQNTGTGQFIKDASMAAVAYGLIPGGSPTQMAAGVQQMVASQGFNVGGNIGRGSPVFGGGAITDMMSKTIFDSIKSSFFDSVTGLSKRNAYGLNMTQMGEAMGQLTARGAFRGMDIGEINLNENGVYAFKQNQDKMEKVNKIFSDYAGMLKDARQIFGDLPIAELTQNAERLIGTSIREIGSVSAMRNRMANIQATSAAFGLNPAAVATQMMQTTDVVQQDLFAKAMQDSRVARDPHLMALTSTAFGKTAANISEYAVLAGSQAGHSSTSAANLYAEQGKFMPTISSDTATRMLRQGMAEVAGPRDQRVTGNVLAAQAMLSTGAIKDPAVAGQVQDLITKMGNTGDIREQAILNQQLARLVNSGGGDIERFKAVYSSTEMMNMMSPQAHAQYSKFLSSTYSNRLAMEGTKNLNIARQDYGLFRQGDVGLSNRKTFVDLITATDKKAQDALFAAVGAGGEIDEAALDKAYENTPALAKVLSKEKFKDAINQFAKDPGRAQGNLKDQLVGIMDTARANPRFSSTASAREKTLADERAVQSYLATSSLGEGLSPEDFGTELVRGFFGAGKIDNNIVLESLRNQDKLSTFNINADKTALSLDTESLGKLSDTIGADNMKAIATALNVSPDNKEELARKLSTPEGFRALQANLGGALMAVDKDGRLSIGKAKDVESETKELEMQSMTTAAKRLLGKDGFFSSITGGGANARISKLDLGSEEGRKQFNEEIVNELTADDGARLSELSDKFKEEGYGGQEFEALRLMTRSNPNIQEAIRKSSENARAEGDIQKATDLKALNRQLDAANGTGGKFLGVLEIMSEGLAQLKLYQE